MKLEYYEITAALAAGNYGQAVDIMLAHFGENYNHLAFQIDTWSRGPTFPYYSVRISYYDGKELSWNAKTGFAKGASYEHMRSINNGLLGRVVILA